MAADSYNKNRNGNGNGNGDRWLGFYRVASLGALTVIGSLVAFIGSGILNGQETLRDQFAEQGRQISAILVRIETAQSNISRLETRTDSTITQVNTIDNRLNRLEAERAP